MSRGGKFKHFIYFRWMITTYLTPEYFFCIEILSISHLPPWKHLDFFCWVEDNNNEFIQIPKKGNFYCIQLVVTGFPVSSFFSDQTTRPSFKNFLSWLSDKQILLEGIGKWKELMLKNDFPYFTFKAKDIKYQVCHKLIRGT